VRRQIVARLRSGKPVAAVASETGICQATLFRWRRQALIDAGVIEALRAWRLTNSPRLKSASRSSRQSWL
jgi:transposase-like protein